MPNLAQVTFTGADNAPKYSYYCDGLEPVVGQWVIVPVGAKQSLKIVRVIELSDEPWQGSFPLKRIWGLVTCRPDDDHMPEAGS
jgi:hypothetical protein